MMTIGGWTHMLSLFCSMLGGRHEWQPIPLGSLVGYNAHTLASLVMVRWKRNRAATGKTSRFQVKPWIWWMNTVTDIPYGKKAWTIHVAAGGDKGHAECINALPQTIPSMIGCFLEAPLILHVQFLVTLHLQKNIPLLLTWQYKKERNMFILAKMLPHETPRIFT